jgi:hypothetical protein
MAQHLLAEVSTAVDSGAALGASGRQDARGMSPSKPKSAYPDSRLAASGDDRRLRGDPEIPEIPDRAALSGTLTRRAKAQAAAAAGGVHQPSAEADSVASGGDASGAGGVGIIDAIAFAHRERFVDLDELHDSVADGEEEGGAGDDPAARAAAAATAAVSAKTRAEATPPGPALSRSGFASKTSRRVAPPPAGTSKSLESGAAGLTPDVPSREGSVQYIQEMREGNQWMMRWSVEELSAPIRPEVHVNAFSHHTSHANLLAAASVAPGLHLGAGSLGAGSRAPSAGFPYPDGGADAGRGASGAGQAWESHAAVLSIDDDTSKMLAEALPAVLPGSGLAQAGAGAGKQQKPASARGAPPVPARHSLITPTPLSPSAPATAATPSAAGATVAAGSPSHSRSLHEVQMEELGKMDDFQRARSPPATLRTASAGAVPSQGLTLTTADRDLGATAAFSAAGASAVGSGAAPPALPSRYSPAAGLPSPLAASGAGAAAAASRSDPSLATDEPFGPDFCSNAFSQPHNIMSAAHVLNPSSLENIWAFFCSTSLVMTDAQLQALVTHTVDHTLGLWRAALISRNSKLDVAGAQREINQRWPIMLPGHNKRSCEFILFAFAKRYLNGMAILDERDPQLPGSPESLDSPPGVSAYGAGSFIAALNAADASAASPSRTVARLSISHAGPPASSPPMTVATLPGASSASYSPSTASFSLYHPREHRSDSPSPGPAQGSGRRGSFGQDARGGGVSSSSASGDGGGFLTPHLAPHSIRRPGSHISGSMGRPQLADLLPEESTMRSGEAFADPSPGPGHLPHLASPAAASSSSSSSSASAGAAAAEDSHGPHSEGRIQRWVFLRHFPTLYRELILFDVTLALMTARERKRVKLDPVVADNWPTIPDRTTRRIALLQYCTKRYEDADVSIDPEDND